MGFFPLGSSLISKTSTMSMYFSIETIAIRIMIFCILKCVILRNTLNVKSNFYHIKI